MRAMRADGEDVVAHLAHLHQQHLLVADMAEELAVDKIRQRDTLGEVRPLRRILLLRHRYTPAFTRSCRETAGEARRRHENIRACGPYPDGCPAYGPLAWSCNDAPP